MIPSDYEIRDVFVEKKGVEIPLPFKRVMCRGKQVGIVLDGRGTEIIFTAPILHHDCDGLMEWFSGIIGEEGVERHPPVMNQEPEYEQEEDYDY